MVVYAFNPSAQLDRRQSQVELCEFRPARSILGVPGHLGLHSEILSHDCPASKWWSSNQEEEPKELAPWSQTFRPQLWEINICCLCFQPIWDAAQAKTLASRFSVFLTALKCLLYIYLLLEKQLYILLFDCFLRIWGKEIPINVSINMLEGRLWSLDSSMN